MLADIARPTIALVNNAQREHLEFMQSVEAVAEENASVFDALPADGVAVLNADDAMAGTFRGSAGSAPRVEFGLAARGEVTGRYALQAPAQRDRAAHARGRGARDARDPGPAQRAQCARRRRVRARRRHSGRTPSARAWLRSGPIPAACR